MGDTLALFEGEEGVFLRECHVMDEWLRSFSIAMVEAVRSWGDLSHQRRLVRQYNDGPRRRNLTDAHT